MSSSDAKILIVEDELVLQLMLEHMLKKMGFSHFDRCTKGQDAIDKAKETHFNLILMDIMLQEKMDGIEAYRQIKEIYNVPVIYITGNTDPRNRERAAKIGFHDYIGKPITFAQLRDSISKIEDISIGAENESAE